MHNKMLDDRKHSPAMIITFPASSRIEGMTYFWVCFWFWSILFVRMSSVLKIFKFLHVRVDKAMVYFLLCHSYGMLVCRSWYIKRTKKRHIYTYIRNGMNDTRVISSKQQKGRTKFLSIATNFVIDQSKSMLFLT